MTREEAIAVLKATKPSWMEDGKGLMGDRTPYMPSEKPRGEVGRRRHDLSLDTDAEVGSKQDEVEPPERCDDLETLKATFTSVVLCGCLGVATALDGTSSFKVDAGLVLNSEFALTRVTNGKNYKSWQYTGLATVTVYSYDSGLCDTAPDRTINVSLVINLGCVNGNKTLLVFADTLVGSETLWPAFFYAEGVVLDSDTDNLLTTCGEPVTSKAIPGLSTALNLITTATNGTVNVHLP